MCSSIVSLDFFLAIASYNNRIQMYLCGNMCNGDTIEPEITVKMD